MQLKHLKSFIAVAEVLHFRKAAEALGIPQPSLSQHVAALEAEVGVRLLDRDRRSVELTKAGALLLDGARVALARLDTAVSEARKLGAARDNTLCIGHLEYVSHAFLPKAIRALQERMPEVTVESRDLPPAEAILALQQGRIDVAFALAPVHDPALVVREVLRGRWSVVLPEEHPLASRATVPLGALAAERLILFHRRINPPAYAWLTQQCEEAGFTPRVAYHVAQPQHGPRLVLENVGVFVVGSYVLPEVPPGVVLRPLAGFDTDIIMVAAWRADHKTPAMRAFLEGLPATKPMKRLPLP